MSRTSQAQFLKLVPQGVAAEFQQLCRFLLVAVRLLQGALQKAALEFGRRVMETEI